MKKKSFYLKIMFGLILFFGIIVRVSFLGEIPTSLYWDEVAILADAKAITKTGRDLHNLPWYSLIRPSYGDYKLNVYILFTSLVVKIWGASQLSARLISCLAGIGNLILIFFFTKKLLINWKNKTLIALSVMFVLAFSPWNILFSRTGFEAHLALFFFNLSLFFVLNLRKNPFIKIFFGVVFAILATYTYYSVRFVWPFIFVLIIFFNLQKVKKKKRFKEGFFYFLKYLSWPMMIYGLALFIFSCDPFYSQFQSMRLGTSSVINSVDPLEINLLRQQAGNNFVARIFFNFKTTIFFNLLKNYGENLSFNFLFFNSDPNLRHSTGQQGLFLLPFLPLFIIGMICLARDNLKIFSLLFFWWLMALLPASVPNNVPHALRSLNASFPVAIFIGIGLAQFLIYYKKLLNFERKQHFCPFKISLVFLYALMIDLSIISFLYCYFGNYQNYATFAWQGGYRQIAERINQDRKKFDKINLFSFDDRFFLWLIAFGDLPIEQIQKTVSYDFRFPQIENINFDFRAFDVLEKVQNQLVICVDNQCQKEIENLISEPKKVENLSFDNKISQLQLQFYYF